MVDVVLPVPSSLVMIAHGAVFGPLVGTVLSIAGSLGAALVGFALGRRGGAGLDRLVPAEQRRRADALLDRWGVLAIVVTRPVPLLAETTVILAGMSRLGWGRSALAAMVGSLPAALLYALAGSVVAEWADPVVVFALVLLLAGATWAVATLIERRGTRRNTEGVA
ncbi:TVP38/TMEM64 family protein [Blastococcus capsensis]|uniref:TVP38/TMEM64 family protein n=1 Tax=Blastococcus capsensis TaxID=1564163 RepID=UPI0025400720|nr:VTT domain-containing protein [Blastococcus capsensis]MDK3255250.1 VTT domain-containing protein [Blastococcus capsensis]